MKRVSFRYFRDHVEELTDPVEVSVQRDNAYVVLGVFTPTNVGRWSGKATEEGVSMSDPTYNVDWQRWANNTITENKKK